MMAPTHIAFGLFTTTGLFSLFSLSLHKDYPALGAAILGSLLPDIDSPNSSLGRWLPFVSVPLERRWGHRTVTHCLLAVGALGVASGPLIFYRTTMYSALLIGYLSHLLADCGTKSGVPLFHPHPAQCVLPGNSRYRVTTGSLVEQGLLGVLLILLGLGAPCSPFVPSAVVVRPCCGSRLWHEVNIRDYHSGYPLPVDPSNGIAGGR